MKKRKMLCYSPLVAGQNATPVLGLCQFISEKNVVQAPRVFKVNSYIEFRNRNGYKCENFVTTCMVVAT